jgi:hypothetical protein
MLGQRLMDTLSMDILSVCFPQNIGLMRSFASTSKTLDASLGFCFLSFATSDISIYAGSVVYSLGKYWFSVRSFITTQ